MYKKDLDSHKPHNQPLQEHQIIIHSELLPLSLQNIMCFFSNLLVLTRVSDIRIRSHPNLLLLDFLPFAHTKQDVVHLIPQLYFLFSFFFLLRPNQRSKKEKISFHSFCFSFFINKLYLFFIVLSMSCIFDNVLSGTTMYRPFSIFHYSLPFWSV